MQIEYEATFENVDKDDIRERLKKAGAKLVRKEFLQKRVTFNLPKGHEISHSWIRVRDEGDKITLTLKILQGEKIEDQKNIDIKVDNFESAVKFLDKIGCQKKSYQESKRELWKLDSVEIMIDEWPFLEPFVEIEGKSEKEVKKVSEKLGFDYAKAHFGCVSATYSKKYGISEETVYDETPVVIFNMKNPFLKLNRK